MDVLGELYSRVLWVSFIVIIVVATISQLVLFYMSYLTSYVEPLSGAQPDAFVTI